MTEYITKGQAVDAAYRAIHYGFNDVHKAMMEGKDLKVNADNFYYTLLENVRAEIAVAPVADVVEVIRCKDCKYRSMESGEFDGLEPACRFWTDADAIYPVFVDMNGFCSEGELKDGGESND